jgi:biotin transport system substrate-specific component
MTLSALWRPRTRAWAFAYDLGLIVCGAALVALASQLSLHLPFSPVPVTGQTFAVLLVGALLGPGRGAAAMAAYLAEGVAGLPVFAGGAAGPGVLLGHTAGYLVGFVPAAAAVGFLATRGWDRRPATTLLAMLLGNAVVLFLGALWLSRFVGPRGAITQGLLPFIPGDIIKSVLAAAVLPGGWMLLARLNLNRPKV